MNTYFEGRLPPRCSVCHVQLTVEPILLHCVSFKNAHDDFFQRHLSIRIVFKSPLTFNNWCYQTNWILSYNLNAGFYHNFNNFHLSFYPSHNICVYPIYQYLNCSYIMNSSVSKRIFYNNSHVSKRFWHISSVIFQLF